MSRSGSDTVLEDLETEACLTLLDQNHLGRLAIVEPVRILPVIVAVNDVLHRGAVVRRTDEVSKLSAVRRGQPRRLRGRRTRRDPASAGVSSSAGTASS